MVHNTRATTKYNVSHRRLFFINLAHLTMLDKVTSHWCRRLILQEITSLIHWLQDLSLGQPLFIWMHSDTLSAIYLAYAPILCYIRPVTTDSSLQLLFDCGTIYLSDGRCAILCPLSIKLCIVVLTHKPYARISTFIRSSIRITNIV